MADTLPPGHSLAPGESLISRDGAFEVVYQMDGNFVLYRTADRQAVWDTKTAITPPGAAIMQTDGNFVLYKAGGGGVPYWATGTNKPGSSLKFINNTNLGALEVVDSGGAQVWASAVLFDGDPLQVGGCIVPGGRGINSPNGHYWLAYNPNGNLVVIRGGDLAAVWDSGTTGKPVGFAVMQWDGNFVLYGPGGHEAWWASGTNVPGSVVAMQNDGNLVVYDPSGNALWASNTEQAPFPKVVLFGLDYSVDRFTRIGHSNGPLTGSAAITLVTNKTGYTVQLDYTIDNVVEANATLSNGGSTNAFNGRNATADWAGVVQRSDGGPPQGIFPFEIQYE